MKIIIILLTWIKTVICQRMVSKNTLLLKVDPKCLFNITIDSTNFITIGSDSMKVESKKTCAWIIETTLQYAVFFLEFKEFDLIYDSRCRQDYVTIYTQDSKQEGRLWQQKGSEEGYCGKILPFPFSFLEEKKRLIILCASSGTVTTKGFKARISVKITGSPPQVVCLNKYLPYNSKEASCDAKNKTFLSTVVFDTFTLECDVRAIPMATVSWWKIQTMEIAYKNETNETISRFPNKTFTNVTLLPVSPGIIKNMFKNGSIQLYRLQVDDSGDYRCIAQNKYGQASWDFTLDVEEKCLCTKIIKTSWYPYIPYTRYRVGTAVRHGIEIPIYKGIINDILPDLMKNLCGSCGRKNAGKTFDDAIHWDDGTNLLKNPINVNGDILNDSADIFFPILNTKYLEKYLEGYYFIPLIESPGTVFFVKEDKSKSQEILFNTIIRGWPLYIIMMLFAMCSGIIYWMLDVYWNEELSHSFVYGSFQGTWWAFVSMTSVGYGDIVPKGVPGRLFAIGWVLCGLVILSLFTGLFTAVLSAGVMTTKTKLYNQKVGAIRNSSEYKLGVVKNAKMRGYWTLKEIRYALITDEIKGALVDAYVASHFGIFSEYRINKIFPSNKVYGIVLGSRLSTRSNYDRMLYYVEKNKEKLVADISKNVKLLQKDETSDSVQKSKWLIDRKNPYFKDSVNISLILLFVFAVAGLLVEYTYLKPRQHMMNDKMELLQTFEITEMVGKSKLLKQNLLSDLAEFKERIKIWVKHLNRKHKTQIQLLKDRLKKEKLEKRKEPQVDNQEDMFEMSAYQATASSTAQLILDSNT